jgi:RNA polymerase sigma-70 factor (ECF subfamily)
MNVTQLETELENSRGVLLRYLARITGDMVLSEDLLQEASINILRYAHTFNPERATFHTWAVRIARNVFYRHLRHSSVGNPLYLDDLGPESQPRGRNTFEVFEGELVAEQIREILKELPEPERSIVRFKRIERLGLRETARRVGLSTRSVSRRLLRGLDLVRVELERLGIPY